MRVLSRRPTLQRVVLVNMVIILAGAVLGVLVTRRLAHWPDVALIILFFVVGAGLMTVANYLVLRSAFRPLLELSDALAGVHKGERRWEPPAAIDVDPGMRDVSLALADMLERLDVESKAYSGKIFDGIENERRRIGRELHDETTQSLAAALLNLDMAEKNLGGCGPEVLDRIARSRELIQYCLGQLKVLIYDLRPSMLDDFGLASALRWYMQSHLRGSGLEVQTDLPTAAVRLPAHVETALYRIAQESLANVLKHSFATRVFVSLEVQPGYVALQVADNGCGFDRRDVILDREGRYGVGLLSIKERTELLGGTLHIESAPGRGTQVHVVIPLHGGSEA